MSEDQKPLRIVRLESQNVKRLHGKPVVITPGTASIVEITGKNGQGKSSIIDSIEYALAGTRSHPPQVIHQGERRASVLLDLGDIVVQRVWSEKGSTLEVINANGTRVSSPQSILDTLIGKTAFDPVAFMRKTPAQQATELRELAGLDFSEQDRTRAELVSTRTAVKRQLDALRAEMQQTRCENPGPVPAIADLLQEQDRRVALVKNMERKVTEIEQAKNSAVSAHFALCDLMDECSDHFTRLLELDGVVREGGSITPDSLIGQAQAAKQAADQHVKELEAQLEAVVVPDMEEIPRQLASVQELQQKADAFARWQEKGAKAQALQAQLDDLANQIEAIDDARSTALREAHFPVPGLSVDDDGPTYNGLPLTQASQAEQLRVSVAMGLALHPRLRIMSIRDGSLLDSDSMALLEQLAEEHDAQVWVETVDSDQPGAIVIEDGTVREESGVA